jgi:putative tryptophan/tyrosine transport system substrate-binding protein
MTRRKFIAGLLSTLAYNGRALSQQAILPVVGLLITARNDNAMQPLLAAFRRGLREAGFADGQNVEITYRWAENRLDQLPALARDLEARRVSVIAVIGGSSAAEAAKAATPNIPIVFRIGSDPVERGLVASLNRPGANVTGVNFLTEALTAKRLEKLLELVPSATSYGY